MQPEVDVVISLFANRQFPAETYFEACIGTLVKHTKDFRLILVDDHCDEIASAVLSRVAKEFRNSVLIRSNYQRWFTRAYNLGLRLVRTPRAILLNVDTVVDEGWLEELQAVWADAEARGLRVGLVGSDLNSQVQERWVETRGRDYVTGHCWFASMQALYEVSAARGMPGWYLDETKAENIHIRSDVEMCWGMNRLGWATVRSYKSAVGHHGGKSWGHCLANVQGLTLESVAD